MHVPLDRLYNHLDSLCNRDMIIYRFYPHGSKNPENLLPIKKYAWLQSVTKPVIICHDQEPLCFERFVDLKDFLTNKKFSPAYIECASGLNLRGAATAPQNGYDLSVLVHSEKNSAEVALYENNGYISAYWWSHAAIAYDWFRYAAIDSDLLADPDHYTSDFLVYNRDWSDAREYRITLAAMLKEKNLLPQCKTKFSFYCHGRHYSQHQWSNPLLKVSCNDMEMFFQQNDTLASASADYDQNDYSTCAIEVVLETVFDDQRHHLTEKTLRAIACGKPFILAATPGSLNHLKDHGFETFDPWINEQYDTVQCPRQRLEMITQEMQRIAALPMSQKKLIWHECNVIANKNKKLFFSDSWQNNIWQELQDNVASAVIKLKQGSRGHIWNTMQRLAVLYQQSAGTKRARGQADIDTFELWLKN